VRIYNFSIGIFLCVLLAAIAAAADDRITAPVDPGSTVVLKGHIHPGAQPRFDQGPVAPETELRLITVVLKPAGGLESFLAEQQSQSSPNYHQWLTPEQFADRFGLSGSDLQKVSGWLSSQGFSVNQVARGRHWITFSGTAAQVGSALHTEIHRYVSNGESHIANSTDPSIPAALAGVVSGFTGLNDFGLKPMAMRSTAPAYNSGSSHFIVPEDFATIYNIAPLYKAGIDGTGQKIAIAGQTDVVLSDLRAFRAQFKLAAKDPKMVLFGADPGITGDLIEADLDLEWSGAVAPNATIIYVYSQDVFASAQYAIDQNLAPVVSMSYGGCEAANQPGLRVVAQQANAQGITWVASSGDWGAATCDITSPTPQASKGLTGSFPATIPEITAIGGTTFNEGSGTYWVATNDANDGSALSYIPEVAWNDSAERHSPAASGGAASVFFSKPVWQTGPGVPNDNARDIPDVALAASPDHDGFEVATEGTFAIIGGTSVGTPSFAAIVALMNQYLVSNGTLSQPGLGNVNPALYRMAQATSDVFHDVTSGNNDISCEQGSPSCINGFLGYNAGPGYDLTTGLGSINVNNLATEWSTGTSSTTSLSANPTSYNVTDMVKLVAAVTGGKTPPTGMVTFMTDDLSLGTATLTGGAATVSAQGILIAAGSGIVTALYSGDGVYSASAGTAAVKVIVPASGSFVIPSVNPDPVNQSVAVWPYTLTLTEKAGVATKLTGFTINGAASNLAAFNSTNIPAHGTITASLEGTGLTVPLNRDFHFSGVDANGTTWSRDLTVPFIGPGGPGFLPALTLNVATIVQQNPQAGASCQYSQQLTVQETSGFLFLFKTLKTGAFDLSTSIQGLFGTTRIAPYGSLVGTICWPNDPGNATTQLTAESEIGTTVSITASAPFATADAFRQPTLSASPQFVEILGDAASKSGMATVTVVGGSSPWNVSVVPSRASSWLTVSPGLVQVNGTVEAQQLTVQASGAELSNGVYDATLVIQSSTAIANVRVVFVVGGTSAMTIDSVSNAAAVNPVLAPGAMAVIKGSNLAPTQQAPSRLPLAESLGGVSVTVNGITAPIYSIASGELTVQIPYETGIGTAVLGVNNNGQVGAYLVPINVAAPQFFTDAGGFLAPTNTARAGQTATAFMTGDGDVTPFLPTGAPPPSGTATKNLPKPGFSYTLTIGGMNAPITFIGVPPGLVGVTQINFTVPANFPTGVQTVTLGPVLSAVISPVLQPVVVSQLPTFPSASLKITAASGK